MVSFLRNRAFNNKLWMNGCVQCTQPCTLAKRKVNSYGWRAVHPARIILNPNLFPKKTINPLPLGDQMHKFSTSYKTLCTEYYDLDKPQAPHDALDCYLKYAEAAKGPILEPMCGSGRFLIPFLKKGLNITGFDNSSHMITLCQKKCRHENLHCNVQNATFENFTSDTSYQLIFIPSGSFCLLTDPSIATKALSVIHKFLAPKGKFVFEVDTISSKSVAQGQWTGSCIDKPDGEKLVLSKFAQYDLKSRIESILCKYELWESNSIARTEVEDFRVRLYEMPEIESMLQTHGFNVVNKMVPYSLAVPDNSTETVLYECMKA